MSNRNGISKFVGVCVLMVVTVLLALFSFSYQKSSQAYYTAVGTRERVSVIESQFKELKARFEEQRSDIKEIKETVSTIKADVRSLLYE